MANTISKLYAGAPSTNSLTLSKLLDAYKETTNRLEMNKCY